MPPILKREQFADAKQASAKERFNAENRAVQASVLVLFRQRGERLEFDPQATAG